MDGVCRVDKNYKEGGICIVIGIFIVYGVCFGRGTACYVDKEDNDSELFVCLLSL